MKIKAAAAKAPEVTIKLTPEEAEKLANALEGFPDGFSIELRESIRIELSL